MQVATSLFQQQNRVDDQLTRSMVGNLSSSTGSNGSDRRISQVLETRSPTQGVDRRMLQQKQLVLDLTAFATLNQTLLKYLGRLVAELGIATETARPQSRPSGKS